MMKMDDSGDDDDDDDKDDDHNDDGDDALQPCNEISVESTARDIFLLVACAARRSMLASTGKGRR